MKSRVFTIISLLALVVAMTAAATATAQSPAQDVYGGGGEVLDVVQGGGDDTTPSICSDADGLDAEGNSVTTGSNADCAEGDVSPEICAGADGLDANGDATTKGSSADCAEAAPASVCSSADGRDANGNAVSYGSAADCATAVPKVSSGELPFTGFQAGLVALAGLGLLGAGFAMRRVARHDA